MNDISIMYIDRHIKALAVRISNDKRTPEEVLNDILTLLKKK